MPPRPALQRLRVSPDVRLAYVSIGPPDAQPVLLLHAWDESRRSFDRMLRLLPAGVHAIALDQRGHGDSDAPPGGYSLQSVADDVVAFIDAAGLAPVVLLGSSSGGYVAQQVASTSPERVAGLVLVGSPRTLQDRPEFADEVLALTDPIDPGWVRQFLNWFPLRQPVPDWYLQDRISDGVRIPAHVWRQAFSGLCEARPPTEARQITTPTSVIWGDRDDVLTREHQDDLVAALPSSRLIVYEDTGHLVLWEQPERLVGDLRAHLERLSTPTT